METKKYGALTSSQDSNEIANKVKGFVLGLSSILILLASLALHIQLSAQDMISLATELGTVAGAIWTIYGFGLNAIALFYQWKASRALKASATVL